MKCPNCNGQVTPWKDYGGGYLGFQCEKCARDYYSVSFQQASYDEENRAIQALADALPFPDDVVCVKPPHLRDGVTCQHQGCDKVARFIGCGYNEEAPVMFRCCEDHKFPEDEPLFPEPPQEPKSFKPVFAHEGNVDGIVVRVEGDTIHIDASRWLDDRYQMTPARFKEIYAEMMAAIHNFMREPATEETKVRLQSRLRGFFAQKEWDGSLRMK